LVEEKFFWSSRMVAKQGFKFSVLEP